MLSFKDQIVAMTGGREAILATARLAAPPKTKKEATAQVLAAIRVRLREPITALIDARVQGVEDLYEVMEGEAPEGEVANAWWAGLHAAVLEALRGDITDTIGEMAVREWAVVGDETEVLVTRILERGIADPAYAISKCGITPEDIKALVGTDAPPEAEVTEVESAPAQTRKRTRAPSLDRPTPISEAARAVLQALIDHSSLKEAEIAEALGVSRPQANNYRNGKTVWEPSDEQTTKLGGLVALACSRLTEPWNQLEVLGL